MNTKIPLYNYLNMVLTGMIFIGCLFFVFIDDMNIEIYSELISNLSAVSETALLVILFAVVYEIGYVINRLGSIVVEPIFKKTKFIEYNEDYSLFNDAKKEYPILSTLSREYAVSRTQVMLFLLVLVAAIIKTNIFFICTSLVCTFIFTFSVHKHSKKINELMSSFAKRDSEGRDKRVHINKYDEN